ncbi:MAG: phosphate ABC transporter substrate-binding protein [Eubacteriales bacterium]|nr:phosphate ABC transporter substrate-binding protein [Bacillota bacterium]MDP3051280.1 phosphate ABC transporter substrate-binding protein [Eubacteriales bacterium]MDQ7789473.1 phosphate ABC transporter substrate-binding protein [Clostridia bacterium]MDZ4044033.1 phosphate ABC transporter substrate-binding protein [Eubacteriales bacterium]MDZ7610863.1 phosphate ABC transporter substrate-binding protein [Eubacteriales bacterium]
MLKKLLLVSVICFSLMLTACGTKPVTVVGSTALLPLVRTAADMFMEIHPEITVNVSGGGSFTGLAQVASGYISIGTSDVPAPPDDPFYTDLVEHVIAIAPFVIIVHNDVQVDNLTHEQLVGIFTGRITNWQELGHPASLPINIIHRPPSSGSRKVIQETVLGTEQFSLNATVMNSTGEMLKSVSMITGSIGYCDYAYLTKADVKPLKHNGVEASFESVADNSYPIIAYGRMYTKGEPSGYSKAFLDYVLSEEFQLGVLAEMGYVPVLTNDAV